MMEWKICKVADVSTARLCAAAGARFLGLHAINGLTDEKAEQFSNIRIFLGNLGSYCEPVLLTKIADPKVIASFSQKTGIRWLQLHFFATEMLLKQISEATRALCGWNPLFIGVVSAEDSQARQLLQQLLAITDVQRVILDTNWTGGTGRPTSNERILDILSHFPPEVLSRKLLLAGGINATNLKQKIGRFALAGVDVQSGLESASVNISKNGGLIREFSKLLQLWDDERFTYAFSGISVSLTRCAEADIKDRADEAVRAGAEWIHFDDSDGTVTDRFRADSLIKARSLSQSHSCIPYDVHFLLGKSMVFKDRLLGYANHNPLIRIVYVHLSGSEAKDLRLANDCAQICLDLGYCFGFALHAPYFTESSIRDAVQTLHPIRPKVWSLITHSSEHSLMRVKEHDVPLARVLAEVAHRHLSSARLSLDRDMFPSKLALFQSSKPDEVIVGKAFLEAMDKHLIIQNMLAILSSKD